MSLYDRDYIRETQRPQAIPGPKSVVGWLIALNVGVFFADVFLFSGRLSHAMVVYSNTIIRPLEWWRFISMGFAHDHSTLNHLLGNMIGLFFFGRAIENAFGPKKFLAFYMTAIIFGAIGFSIRHLLLGSPNPEFPPAALGASGAVFAVVILFALKYPQARVQFMLIIPMPAWVLGVFYMVYSLVALTGDDRVAHDVHIIGGIYGFVFYKTGWELTQITPRALSELFRSGKVSIPKRNSRVKLYDPDTKAQKLDAEADRILAKLHREGEASLTAKERRILEEYSRRMQQRRR